MEVKETMATYNVAEMLQGLSEEDLLKVKAYIGRLFAKKNADTSASDSSFNPYKPLTREEIKERIEASMKEADKGNLYDAHNASKVVREKYGL